MPSSSGSACGTGRATVSGHLSARTSAARSVPIDLSNTNSPHLLIAGTTGSGKSVALETILRGMTTHYPPDRLRLVLVDPKGTELVDFEGNSEHVDGEIGMDAEDAIHALSSGSG